MLTQPFHTNIWPVISGVFMFLVLLWLTVSLPFVTSAKKIAAVEQGSAQDSGMNNPLTGTSEEKAPGTVNLAEEFLTHFENDFSLIPYQIPIAYIHAHEAIYKAYHGEPPCPPPNSQS